MPPDRSFAPEDVERLVARWSGGTTWHIAPAGDGVSTPVYRLTWGRETRYLRLAEQAGECRIAEKRVYEELRARGLRVPEVVWFDPMAPEVNRSATITSAIPGTPLDRMIDRIAVAAILSRAGDDLAHVNGIPVRGYGWVIAVDEDGGLIAEHSARASWAEEFRAAVAGIPDGLPMDRTHLASVVGEWMALPDRSESTLAHGDLDVSHIYCEDGRYTGLIDFGEIRGADHSYDLGHFLLHDGERLPFPTFPALLAGYLSAAPGATITRREIALQAVVIGVRALSRAGSDPETPYARFLIRRLVALLDELACDGVSSR